MVPTTMEEKERVAREGEELEEEKWKDKRKKKWRKKMNRIMLFID